MRAFLQPPLLPHRRMETDSSMGLHRMSGAARKVKPVTWGVGMGSFWRYFEHGKGAWAHTHAWGLESLR